MMAYLLGWAFLALSPVPFIAVDGVGLPEVGWTTGWVGLLVIGVLFARGKMLTEKAHLEQMTILQSAHEAAIVAKDREIDRIDHDRQEWRTESRIKDAQVAEKDSQLAEKDKQLGHMAEIGRSLESVLTAIRPPLGGVQ